MEGEFHPICKPLMDFQPWIVISSEAARKLIASLGIPQSLIEEAGGSPNYSSAIADVGAFINR